MKRRNKVLLICLGAVALLAVLIAVHHFRVKSKVERYKAELRAQGEVFEWEKLLGEPTPPELNGAPLFKELSFQLPQTGILVTNQINSMNMVARGKAMPGWAQPWNGSLRSKESNSWDEVFADYDSQKDLLIQFHEIRSRPVLDFNLDYSQGPNLLLPHLSGMKGWAQRLNSASGCELRRNHPDAATEHLLSMLVLATGNNREPLLITQLVRIAIASIAGSTTWGLLQSDGLTDADLARLQEAWAELRPMADMEFSLQGERCFSLQTISDMRESSQVFRSTVGMAGGGGPFAPAGGGAATSGSIVDRGLAMVRQGFEQTTAGLAEGAWRTSWSFTDEHNMLRGQQALLEVLRLAMRDQHAGNALDLHQTMVESGVIPERSDNMSFVGAVNAGALRTLFTDSIASYTRILTRTLIAEANARMATTAIALERHRLRHGAYPESFESMVPEFIESVPLDPINGAPLRYRLFSDGSYLLYSIGEDQVDDGGDVEPPEEKANTQALHWLVGRDWVWPRPANREEVLAYWEKEIAGASNAFFPDATAVLDPMTGLPISLEIPATSVELTATESAAADGGFVELMSAEEWQQFIIELATRWTDEYFQTLNNKGGNR